MSITFFSKPEAVEYIRQKGEEGFICKSEHLGGNKNKVSIVTTTDKYKSGAKGLYDVGTGEITSLSRLSTRTKLHELGHKEYGHKGGTMPISELVKQEVEAESYAYEKTGKPTNYRVAIPAFVTLVEDFGETDDKAVEVIAKVLKQKGITFTEEDEQELRRFGKD